MSVYFIQSGEDGPIKIGHSSDVTGRMAGLQASHPVELVLLGEFKGGSVEEKLLHRRFGKFHIRGEWFKPDKEILDFIKQSVRDGSCDDRREFATIKIERVVALWVKREARRQGIYVYELVAHLLAQKRYPRPWLPNFGVLPKKKRAKIKTEPMKLPPPRGKDVVF